MNQLAQPDLIHETVENRVLTLTLGNGRAHALGHAMITALHDALTRAARDPHTGAIILSGPGHIFCAGHDLKEIARHRTDPDHGHAYLTRLFNDCATMMQTLSQSPKPTIAMVGGIATAAGLQLVAACDLAFVSPGASVCLPGVKNGGFCTTPAVAVSRCVSRKHLMELLLSGEPRDAQWAHHAGLINTIHPAKTLGQETRAFAETLAARNRNPLTGPLPMGKAATLAHLHMPLDAAYATATDTMISHFMDPDRIEQEKQSRFAQATTPNGTAKGTVGGASA